MPYIVTTYDVKAKQITYDDILDGCVNVEEVLRSRAMASKGATSTRTFYYDDHVPVKYYEDIDLSRMVDSVKFWNEKYAHLFNVNRQSLYTEFKIPKSSGGWRRIDAPNDELKIALMELKDVFEVIYNPGYHTAAFAYIKGRRAIDAVNRHRRNESWWFLKTDFSDFFGSSTEDFVWRMITQIFPFSEVAKLPEGRRELKKALNLCFLSGGLPQGTPISPFLTNVIMIPIDFRFSRDLRNFDGNHFVYTRYADDIHISCKGTFDWRRIISYMRSTLKEFDAPYQIKEEKTHYGSRNGRNWILGVMLNKNNQITIGHKKKRDYKAMIHNFILSISGGEPWAVDEIQYVLGLTSYYGDVEPGFIEKMVKQNLEKHNINYVDEMKTIVSRGGVYV